MMCRWCGWVAAAGFSLIVWALRATDPTDPASPLYVPDDWLGPPEEETVQ